ncbi:hypothetical protein [Croceicoccus gelatinilyticus]|uniref:hypothetical protein n=1 Tax=Croceicoccus gelatinilyticus TaxID=2835536 RepID=UPI001BCF7BF0|nr:hypothetical protein [Croceicoccus gelatinilyticus]MBS7671595.1 hypothetical protein [Croceicoccus gelatinilyticus]
MIDLIKTNGTVNRHCAWIVTDKEDFKGAVVFAVDETHARGKGARVLCDDDDISYIEARRFPDGDQFYDAGPIPASFLAHSGFTFECSGCGRTISEDECHERALYLDDVQGTQDSSVYCNIVCEAEDRLSRARATMIEQRFIRRAKRLIRARFPKASFDSLRGAPRADAYARYAEGQTRLQQGSVDFIVPGLAHPVSLKFDRRSNAGNRLSWFSSKVDVDDFRSLLKDSSSKRMERS